MKALKIAGMVFGAFLVLIIVTSIIAPKNTQTAKSQDQHVDSTTRPVEAVIDGAKSRYIPGLAPVDVYLSMKKQDFTVEKKMSSEYGNTWTNKSSVPGIEYIVETYSRDINKVESVRATAMIDVTIKTIDAVRPFLAFVASVPYEGAQPETAQAWVTKNFNNDHAKTSIAGVTYEIMAPTKAVRMLMVTPQ